MGAADESSIYRDLMRFKPADLSPNGWAVKAGVSRAVWADMRRHGNPSRRTLEKLLAVAGSSLAEFEALRLGGEPRPNAAPGGRLGEHADRGWIGAPVEPLPLVSTSLAGEWGESRIEITEIRAEQVLERLPRPPSLASDPSAYAITIVGDSMMPRFRPGRRVAVSPRTPVAIGDDVLVRLQASPDAGKGRAALIGELVRRATDHVELRQFNPAMSWQIAGRDVESLERIVGELI